jgi:ribonucleoside-triphosphate reductase
MQKCGIGYGSVNHPVDRDPICGFTGIIKDECPHCHRKEDEGEIGFERIRRITGYLVGTLDRFNNAKRAEESDRVKHGL